MSVNKSYISKLKLTHYRNYNTLNLELPDKPVALIGSNGIGKTNILEAISLLQPGRGIRSAKFKEMTYKQNGSFGIFIELVSSEEKILIGTAFDDQVSRIRKIKINENNYISQLDLTKYLRIISLTPLMDKIFIESPKNRRKFIDRITWNFFPEHSVIMRAYDKVLKERNNLLKDKTSDFKWLENIEKQIVDFGTKILLNRNKAIKMLVFKLVERKKLNNVFPIADIFLVGELEELYNKQAGDNFINLYKEKLFNYRELDSLKGSSSLGPHRTELRVNYEEKNMPAYLCSTGEQKGLLISLVLAAVKSSIEFHGSSPILLLDEVFTHLDEDKRSALSQEIIATNTQAWMTSTEASHYMTFNGKSCIIDLHQMSL